MPDAEFTFYANINVSTQIMSCAILLVLMGSLFVKKMKTRQEKLFLTVVALHFFSTFSNVVAWLSAAKPEQYFLTLNRTAVLLTYVAESLLAFFLLLYAISVANQKTREKAVSKWILRTIMSLGVFLILAVVASQWGGFIYTIDENNRYFVGDYYLLAHFIPIIQVTLYTVQVIIIRKFISKRDFKYLISFMLLPVLTLIVGMIDYNIEVSYPLITITLLLIYVNVQQEQEKRLAHRELELADSRAAVMLSQIQPHFLYNALNAIEDMCGHDPRKAKTAVRTFAQYLRGNMDSLSRNTLIPFEREMAHVRHYIWLEELRFEERLKVAYDIQTSDFSVPALTLQPIVENAVKHGVTEREEGGTITVTAAETETDIVITVSDDGVGFDPAKPQEDGRSHIGIENVRSRLAAMCGGTLSIQSREGSGATATITIPKGVVPK